MLVDDLELRPVEEELPKLPVVPAPELIRGAGEVGLVFRLLGRYVFRQVVTSALLGTLLATFIIFLQYADKLFAALVSSNNADPGTVLVLLGWTLPPVLPLTIPFGVLVGILIGLGRMAGDGEIVAMRAAGVSSRKVIAPVLLFAALGTALAGMCALRLTPYSIRQSTEILTDWRPTRFRPTSSRAISTKT